jgi:enoyl-CoA hydratase/carnithine racemase
MYFEFIDLERVGPVGWFRFNRGPVNAVHWPMLDQLEPAFAALRDDPDVRVIVIASALERHFNSGADISIFEGVDGARMAQWVATSHGIASAVRNSPKPVLAAINGVAVGGGLEMTLHADLRFAAADARLGQPEVNIGFIPPVAGTQGLVRLIGRSNAFKTLYGGELVDATRALDMGLVDFVVQSDRLAGEVQAYGEMLASKPANTLASIRRCLIEGGGRDFDAGLEIERAEAIALADHANFAEGVAAFLAKRKAEWT